MAGLDEHLRKALNPSTISPHTIDGDQLPAVKSVCCVGAGYVGGPTAAVIAYFNPHIQVNVVDLDVRRIRKWNSAHIPVHEPGLNDIVRIARDGLDACANANKTERPSNLAFSTDVAGRLSEADIILLAVNTSTKVYGLGAGSATDMAALESAVRTIALSARPGAIIVEKSTVPVRTADLVRRTLAIQRPNVYFEVLSNPEFLAEGTAIPDLMNPDRVLIGSAATSSGAMAAKILASVYGAWVPASRIRTTNLYSSELAKLAANAMLAQRISSINSLSAICEATGAKVSDMALAIGLDARIGPKFLAAGVGFGGSCFKKDILSLCYLAKSLNLPEVASYWESVLNINDWQKRRFATNIIKRLNGSLRGKKVTMLGYAFKADTNDTRETAAVEIIQTLVAERPREIAVYDPGCNIIDLREEFRSVFGDLADLLTPYDDPYQACEGADALAIITEWDQFRHGASKEKAPKRPLLHRNLQASSGSRSYFDCMPYLRPDLPCAEDCTDCAQAAAGTTKGRRADGIEILDYRRIAAVMRGEPKWVFDGRGVLEENSLESLGVGFVVESIGKGI